MDDVFADARLDVRATDRELIVDAVSETGTVVTVRLWQKQARRLSEAVEVSAWLMDLVDRDGEGDCSMCLRKAVEVLSDGHAATRACQTHQSAVRERLGEEAVSVVYS